uniref:Uncharacterized protein n=1 Tax=viral metagenome TaxID=1070528 RepID=A0A6C0IYL5_9ZZZZ
MYLGCYDTKLYSFRTRINFLVVGIILIILGVQSTTQMFNDAIQNYKYINIITIVFLTLGPFLIFLSFIHLGKKNNDYTQINL